MDKQQIIFPSEEEKEKSISLIVAKGMPRPHNFYRELCTMFQTIGFRGLFFGVGDSIFLAVLCTIFILCSSVLLMHKSEDGIVVILFLISPFLYGIVQAMTTWKEWMTGMYEQKMVCRYTLRQVNTLRMLLFGGISVVLCIGGSMVFSIANQSSVTFLRFLGIAFTALVLFAVLDLSVRWHCKTLFGNFLASAFWVILGIFMLYVRVWMTSVLMELPVIVFWVLAAGGAIVYARMLYHWYFVKKEGAFSYAVN